MVKARMTSLDVAAEVRKAGAAARSAGTAPPDPSLAPAAVSRGGPAWRKTGLAAPGR